MRRWRCGGGESGGGKSGGGESGGGDEEQQSLLGSCLQVVIVDLPSHPL